MHLANARSARSQRSGDARAAAPYATNSRRNARATRASTPRSVETCVQENPSTSLQHDFVRVDASNFCV
jgi:hypothetical protein